MELMALAMLLVVDGDAAREIVATKAKAKGSRRANQNQNAKLLARIAKHKTKIDSRQCQICVEYRHWSRGCPNRMVQQVVKTGQHGIKDIKLCIFMQAADKFQCNAGNFPRAGIFPLQRPHVCVRFSLTWNRYKWHPPKRMTWKWWLMRSAGLYVEKSKTRQKKNLMGIPSITTFMTFIWPINLPPGSGPKNHVIPHVKKLW